MKRENLSVQAALEQGAALPFALLRTWDQVHLGPTPAMLPDVAELVEARFFDEQREIRLFRRDRVLCAASLAGEPGDRTLEETYELEPSFGKALTFCRLLEQDEDGQTFFAATRLSRWEGN